MCDLVSNKHSEQVTMDRQTDKEGRRRPRRIFDLFYSEKEKGRREKVQEFLVAAAETVLNPEEDEKKTMKVQRRHQ